MASENKIHYVTLRNISMMTNMHADIYANEFLFFKEKCIISL